MDRQVSLQGLTDPDRRHERDAVGIDSGLGNQVFDAVIGCRAAWRRR